MKKTEQETEIATNISSGAEKVEIIEKETKKARSSSAKPRTTTKSVKKITSSEAKPSEEGGIEHVTLGTKKSAASEKDKKTEKISAKKINSETSGSRAEKESQAAKARVEAALKKKEAQAKRKEERKRKAEQKAQKAERRAKRVAERKALIEKLAAEQKALAEKRAATRKEKAEKRAAAKKALAEKRANAKKNKQQKQDSSKKKERGENRRNKKERNQERRKDNGYGGWIAAVVSLGVVSLALATTVTVGAIEMKNATDTMMSSHRSTMYELTGVMENVDNNLDRIRISNSTAQQERILTDLLVQTRLAEQDVEKLPISAEENRNVTAFINKTAAECERLLSKLQYGGSLSAEDRASLEKLYSINHNVRMELNKLLKFLSDKDMSKYIKDKKGAFSDALQRIEKATIEENKVALERSEEKKEGAGTDSSTQIMPREKQEAHIEPADAEALCKRYFSAYKIGEYQCVGETVNNAYSAYNVQGYDDKGTMLFAEISQQDGALLRFDYYEDCMGENFTLKNAEQIAENFLQSLGYEDLELVRLRENGTTMDFTFVYEEDGVAYYPDELRIKVCCTRGVVTGLDATRYMKNHKERKGMEASITLAQAYERLHKALTVESSKLAVVETQRGERPAYEFLCSYGDGRYFVYLDAKTGEEIAIVNVDNLQA